MLELAMEENPEIKISFWDLLFVKELICGGDRKKLESGEYPYSARGPDKFYLYEIISNIGTGIDVDKMDYMARDSQALGIRTKFDYARFLEAGEPRLVSWPLSDRRPDVLVTRIAVREKMVTNIQNLFQDRTDLHTHAYQHKTVRIFDQMYVDVWKLADRFITVLGRNGELLPLSRACEDEVALSKLTEGWILQCIRNSTTVELQPARELLRRIDTRKLYKTVAHIHSLEESMEEVYRLRNEAVTVTKIQINMGRNDRSNPVEQMIFYHKGSREGHVKTKEELKKFVPEQTYDEQVYVLVKKEDDQSLNDARDAVSSLAAQHPGWRVTFM